MWGNKKKGKIIIMGHRIVNNYYAINPISKTPIVCSKTKLYLTELWHRRLGHINYKDLVHLVNNEKIRGILKLSGEPKPICGECMKGKQRKVHIERLRKLGPLDL